MELNLTYSSRGSRDFLIERDLPPALAVYVLTTIGFILHVVVLMRRVFDDSGVKKSVLLNTLSTVDIAFCVFLAVKATYYNHVYNSSVLSNVLKYTSFIPIYH